MYSLISPRSSARSSPHGRSYDKWRGASRPYGMFTGTRRKAFVPLSLELGPLISSIEREDVLPEESAPKISNSECVASYNWVNSKDPTILVPGRPPAWTPPIEDRRLQPDEGVYFRDMNAAKFPHHPLEPVVKAVMIQEPDFNFSKLDILACSNALLRLLSFVQEDPVAFAIEVEYLNDVVFLTRREGEPTKLIEDVYGFGHTFPEAYTSWDSDVAESENHQRVIRYDFGGIQVLMQYTADGYLKDDGAPHLIEAARPSALEDAFACFKVSKQAIPSIEGVDLTVKRKGVSIPQSQIIEIKTRTQRKPIDEASFLHRLWITSTSHLLLARHYNGLFDSPEPKNMENEIREWETENSAVLAKFHGLLSHILSFARDPANDSKFIVSWDGLSNELKFTKPAKERDALSEATAEVVRGSS